ncbi:alpha/beta fold hydrolase [Modestobacter sp. I12A-02628]|uniref:Alpha/beta hydrolase n=1 Tax=Goekera deserti TaxID=2497753 RepID=A0A7K3W819_9ACTN|nr:alpha/beta hydrolase [Goekera deserti]MPQ99830.1 alpha/beta fold hydrolase [Goekera deserti]NDI49986.1 alpha/beta fold hydrolase [Goekera deserti]NEL52537.1 alpha/beta hydrolase [Goekera deserti]
MVLPGGSEQTSSTALRQLAEHDALAVTLTGRTGPLAALDTGARAADGPGSLHGTVLMIAGYTGSKEDFAPLLGPLAQAGLRVVTLDQRGQFESPGPDDPAAYTVTELAADVLAVAAQLRDDASSPLHLVGHSFGGLVARAAVLADPGAFTSLTLLGSGPGRLTGPRADMLDHLAPLMDAGGVQLVHETLEQLAMTDPRTQLVPAPVRAFLARRFLANNPAGLRGMADAMLAEPDRVAELAATGLPVLVAHGSADDAWTPAAQADMARRLGARHEVVEGSVHSPAIEAPDRTRDLLLAFWTSVVSPDDARDADGTDPAGVPGESVEADR